MPYINSHSDSADKTEQSDLRADICRMVTIFLRLHNESERNLTGGYKNGIGLC
jgi:hypothetical protein